jgi:dimethylargininase
MLMALTRGVSDGLARCELTHLAREPINVERARAQHAEYEKALQRLGALVRRIPGEAGMPDCVFIEDTAVVLDEVGVMMLPGAASRRGEVMAVEAVLRAYRPVVRITRGTIDGGDVLRVGKQVYVGRSGRTNDAAIAELGELIGRFGYAVQGVEIRGCLHLKSAVTEVGQGIVLVNPAWVDRTSFTGMDVVAVEEQEGHGANAVRLGGAVIYPEHFPRTAERLERAGIRVERVACDELAKAEGAVTCCSLVFEAD